MKTKSLIVYKSCGTGQTFEIPAGTTVVKANNLPGKDLYFAKGWRRMPSHARSFKRNYGFLLTKSEIQGK